MSETIQGTKSSLYVKDPVPGVTNSTDTMTHQSVQNLWNGRGAADVLIHGFFTLSSGNAIEVGSVKRKIKITGHGALVGDFILLEDGNALGEEVAIIKVIDADFFIIAKEINAAIGDLVSFLRAVTPSYNQDGSLNVVAAQGPIRIEVDGVSTVVGIDTVVPANSVPMPVEIRSATGPINITAGDLNVQLTDVGVNADVTRIGDGTNRLGINANLEALVHDTDGNAKLDTIDASVNDVLAAVGDSNTALGDILTELELKANLTETQPVSESPKTPTFQEILNLTNVMQTFIAPANVKTAYIQADDTNLANIRVKFGGSATVSSGHQLQPGRSEPYDCSGNVTVICETADVDQKVCVTFGV